MKILVIDDTKRHRDTALQTLSGHEVKLASTYDEGETLICKQEWDAVLCDLLMPPSGRCQNYPEKFTEEMPIGWGLALLAAKKKVKYVAVATDTNHHDHPASAVLDYLLSTVFDIGGETRLLMTDAAMTDLDGQYESCVRCNGTGKPQVEDDLSYCYACGGKGKNAVRGKDWGRILHKTMTGKWD